MGLEFLSSLLKKNKNEPIVSVDIGTSAIKVMELDLFGEKPRLLAVGVAPTPGGAVHNNIIKNPAQVATQLRSLLDSNGISANKAIFAVPGPAAFTKKINMANTSLKELTSNLHFEASNYIPHRIDAVNLDFQVLGANGRSTIEVLLVAVKQEIVASYLDTLQQAGLDPVIADVDYFALENMFELAHPEAKEKTVAVINLGARYSSVNIIKDGKSLFTGDVAVGGRLYTDALCETLQMQPLEAEQAKMGQISDKYDPDLVHETMERTNEHIASELQRQLGFFWNAAATDRPIEEIYLCGGAAQTPGLLEELSTKTEVPSKLVEPLRGIDCSGDFDGEYLREIGAALGISVGLAMRRPGDKQHAISA